MGTITLAAAGELCRAGRLLYSWGLRFFLIVVPLVAGIVSPLAMLPMTLVLVSVLWFFDRPAKTPPERTSNATGTTDGD